MENQGLWTLSSISVGDFLQLQKGEFSVWSAAGKIKPAVLEE